MRKILTGKEVVENIKKQIQERQNELIKQNTKMKLTILRVGNNLDDLAYQKSATKRCENYGINVEIIEASNDENKLKKQFDIINNSNTSGLLILGKIPSKELKEYICENINPEIDVDGLGYFNMAKLYTGNENAILPCTAEAVMELLKYENIDLSGKKIAVIGRSLVIGKPLAIALINKNATVTICHSKTQNLKQECKNADIICTSIGKARLIDKEYIKSGSIVIDIGINYDSNGNLCGDVDFDDVKDIVSAITPVPKGIGTITNMILIKHIYKI